MENYQELFQRLADSNFPNVTPERQHMVRKIAKLFSAEVISSNMCLKLNDETYDEMTDAEFMYFKHVLQYKYHIAFVPFKGFELQR